MRILLLLLVLAVMPDRFELAPSSLVPNKVTKWIWLRQPIDSCHVSTEQMCYERGHAWEEYRPASVILLYKAPLEPYIVDLDSITFRVDPYDNTQNVRQKCLRCGAIRTGTEGRYGADTTVIWRKE